MTYKLIIFLFFLIVTELFGHESDKGERTDSQGSPTTVNSGEHDSKLGDRECLGGRDPLGIPETELEKVMGFLQLIKDAPTKEDVPINILLMDLTMLEYLKGQGGFQAQYFGSMLVNIPSYIPTGTFGTVVKMLAKPTVLSRLQALPQGDAENFPPYTLDEVYKMLDGINDRNAFAKLTLKIRAKSFNAKGIRVTTTGYEGYAIVKDFQYGSVVGRLGEEHNEILKNIEKPLDCIVSHNDNLTPQGWIKKYFVLDTPNSFRKLPRTCNKDSYNNTWLLYELAAGEERMVLEVIRKPKDEYEKKVTEWNDAWLRNHPSEQKDVNTPSRTQTNDLIGAK